MHCSGEANQLLSPHYLADKVIEAYAMATDANGLPKPCRKGVKFSTVR